MSYFCRGGDWKTGGSCHLETLPELGSSPLPQKAWAHFLNPFINMTLPRHFHGPIVDIDVLNVSQMTARRKDGHLSLYYLGPSGPAPLHRQDCSHWCLPGVPDIWNELLYAFFLKSLHRRKFSIHQNTSRMSWAHQDHTKWMPEALQACSRIWSFFMGFMNFMFFCVLQFSPLKKVWMTQAGILIPLSYSVLKGYEQQAIYGSWKHTHVNTQLQSRFYWTVKMI